MNMIDIPRQRYMDMIHRYLKGRLERRRFAEELITMWDGERDTLWRSVCKATSSVRSLDAEILSSAGRPRAGNTDPRRLCRMVDRLCVLFRQGGEEALFRASVVGLLAAFRDPETTIGEGEYVAYPPRVPIFKRALPGGSRHKYPCTVEDIRKQLAFMPEYDLQGLWAVGLVPADRDTSGAYGIYYRRKYPMRKPVIFILSRTDNCEFKWGRNTNPGYMRLRLRVELDYGMKIERREHGTFCHWPEEDGRQFIVEHVIPHEVGHHVQYQQRARAGHRRSLRSAQSSRYLRAFCSATCLPACGGSH